MRRDEGDEVERLLLLLLLLFAEDEEECWSGRRASGREAKEKDIVCLISTAVNRSQKFSLSKGNVRLTQDGCTTKESPNQERGGTKR